MQVNQSAAGLLLVCHFNPPPPTQAMLNPALCPALQIVMHSDAPEALLEHAHFS